MKSLREAESVSSSASIQGSSSASPGVSPSHGSTTPPATKSQRAAFSSEFHESAAEIKVLTVAQKKRFEVLYHQQSDILEMRDQQRRAAKLEAEILGDADPYTDPYTDLYTDPYVNLEAEILGDADPSSNSMFQPCCGSDPPSLIVADVAVHRQEIAVKRARFRDLLLSPGKLHTDPSMSKGYRKVPTEAGIQVTEKEGWLELKGYGVFDGWKSRCLLKPTPKPTPKPKPKPKPEPEPKSKPKPDRGTLGRYLSIRNRIRNRI